jgi:cytochrome P450 family 4
MMRFWKRSDFLFKFSKDKKRYDECLEIIRTFTRGIVEKRREALLNENESLIEENENLGIKKKMALLDILLKSTINGQPLTNADIIEEVDTFMFEGHDTTTAATCFSLYLLSQNSSAQQKVYEEVTRIVGDDLSAYPTYNQLLEMKYLECCIKEALRLFPPVPIIGRNLEEDLELPDGKVIAAGCNINLMIYHINRNAKYFENPEEFKPERFNENVNGENAFLYVPFSAGPR